MAGPAHSLRGLAMAMDAAPRAGHPGQALARLADFLRVTRDVDYVRPLVRHREVGRTLAACGKTHAASARRCIPSEPPRFAGLRVAFRSKYTRYSSLTRLVSRTPTGRTGPHRARRSREFHHRLLVQGLLDADLDEDTRRAAESMPPHLEESSDAIKRIFSRREREVLAEAAQGLQHKEIAQSLKISADIRRYPQISAKGVRYHLKNIYRKTGTGKRADAVRYAQSLGILA